MLSEPPAKTPRLDSELLRKHPHPTLAGAAERTSGDSPMRARLAALEMELEALKQGSDAGSGGLTGADLAAAIKQQTEVLKDTLSNRGSQSSVTAVKADLTSPTLTDDCSDVSQFYEEFEDVCALANNCKGMSFREQLLALRGRCRGSRLKTSTNVYRAAWKSGEVLNDPKAVYDRIKSRHLVFGESREEKEVRVDSEHALLMKGKLSGHQFEPLFEASIAELESVGLGKTPRELYLSYLRKMPANLQKEIRSDKRLWPTDQKDPSGSATLRGPKTWEEAHKVVLEYEHREATHRASANSVFTYDQDPRNSAAAEARKELDKLKAEARKLAKANATAAAKAAEHQSLLALQEKGAGKGNKICFHFRDHGSCSKGKDCPYSHDKELRKQTLADRSNGGGNASYAASSGAGPQGGGKGQGQGEG